MNNKQHPWVFSDVYAWEGDKCVMQVMVFASEEDKQKFEEALPNYMSSGFMNYADGVSENEHTAFCKIRAVQNKKGEYSLLIRNAKEGNCEILYEEPGKSYSDYNQAIRKGKGIVSLTMSPN